MAVFERSTLIRAPFEEVWAFHLTPTSLEAVSPDWLHLTVESVEGPDNESATTFEEGSEVTLSIRPFGVWPRQRWTSRIAHVERTEEDAVFRDTMIEGPFPRWHHTHRFAAVPAGTRMTDRVEYQFPLGPLTGLSGLGWPGFTAIFSDRHRRTRQLLE